MADDIKFNCSEAQKLLTAINNCKNSLNSLANRIENEVKKAGSWWQGPAYDGFKESYVGPNCAKSVIIGVAEDTAKIRSFVMEAAEAKKSWEIKGAGKFR